MLEGKFMLIMFFERIMTILLIKCLFELLYKSEINMFANRYNLVPGATFANRYICIVVKYVNIMAALFSHMLDQWIYY